MRQFYLRLDDSLHHGSVRTMSVYLSKEEIHTIVSKLRKISDETIVTVLTGRITMEDVQLEHYTIRAVKETDPWQAVVGRVYVRLSGPEATRLLEHLETLLDDEGLEILACTGRIEFDSTQQ